MSLTEKHHIHFKDSLIIMFNVSCFDLFSHLFFLVQFSQDERFSNKVLSSIVHCSFLDSGCIWKGRLQEFEVKKTTTENCVTLYVITSYLIICARIYKYAHRTLIF